MSKQKKRVAVIMVIGCMLLGITGSVWAADSSTNNTGNSGIVTGQNGPGKPGAENDKTMLAQLVQDGTLTQAEMDKIVTYLDKKMSSMQTPPDKTMDNSGSDKQQMQSGQGNLPDMWSDLVTAGIITQAQADAIKAKMGTQGAAKTPGSSIPASSVSGLSAGIGVKIDNQTIALNPNPQIVDGRTLAPLRGIFEALGLTVSWDATTQTVVGTKTGTNITLQINSKTATVNGASVSLDVPAQIVNSSTYVPVRFIADSLGVTVNWNSQDRIVEITTK